MIDLREQLQRDLAASFQVEQELAGGGMSRVFLAHDPALGRRVIIKVLSPEMAESVSLERFAREVLTVARLQHPHIVPVLSAGKIDGLPYYVMPYISGASARALIDPARPVSLATVVSILRDVAKALAYAHEHDVVHRDIKPDNILISGNAAVVSDFGIAKAVSAARLPNAEGALTQIGTVIGTPAYMAPEQALGDAGLDHRADLYAFGVMAYELIAGTLPFGDRPVQQMIRAHITDAPPDIASRRSGLPDALARLVMRCLEKDPAARPSSAADVLTALEQITIAPSSVAIGRAIRIALATSVIVILGFAAAALVQRSGVEVNPSPSVAVLPFDNLTGDSASEYFSDGMTEQLVDDLSRANGLRVASRAATFAYKDKRMEPREAAARLHVSGLVTGSVRRVGDQVRVAAELLDGRTGKRLWSERYDRKLDDIFQLQDEIARSITSALKVSLAPASPHARGTDGTTYDLYLRAQHSLSSRNQELRASSQVDSAIALFRRALLSDSAFAPAWGGLAEAYRLAAEHRAPLSVLPRAREAARRAVQLDPSDAAAGIALANITLNVDWDWKAAEREYLRVLALHPNHAPGHVAYANLLVAARRYDEAIEHLDAARAIESRIATDTVAARLVHLRRVGFMSALMDRRDRAEAVLREISALDSVSGMDHWRRGWIMLRWDPVAAADAMERGRATFGDRLPYLSHLGAAYGHAGRRDSTRRIIDELLRRSRTEYVPKDQLFVLYLALGERKTALRWLEQAIEEHHWYLPYLNGHPMAITVRDDPEYKALMRRIGVPESAL